MSSQGSAFLKAFFQNFLQNFLIFRLHFVFCRARLESKLNIGASRQGESAVLFLLLPEFLVLFCVFCIPLTGCLVKHALKSKLSSLVSVLDRPRYNYAYRLLKTLIRLFWLFTKPGGRNPKINWSAEFFDP